MTRRQKEMRRAVERRIAARAAQTISPRSFRAKIRAGTVSMRTALSRASTKGLLASTALILILWVPIAGATVDHLATPWILDARGVAVEAVVDHRYHGRVSHSLEVHTLEGPQFSTELEHWPRGLDVGDRFDLIYDPEQPHRATAAGTPPIDATVVQGALFAVLVLPFGLFVVVFALKLAGRAWRRVAPGRGPDRIDAPLARPRVKQFTYRAAIQHLRTSTDTQPAIMTLAVFVLIPGMLVLGSGTLLVVQAAQAVALHLRGETGTAVVEQTNELPGWGARAEIRFRVAAHPPGETVRTTITNLADLHFTRDVIKIVHDPERPENAAEAGANLWGWSEWNAVTFFVASAAFGAVSFPAVVPRLVRTARGSRSMNGRHGAPDDDAGNRRA